MQACDLNLLRRIQKQLTSIYEIEIDYDIGQFTLTDPTLADAISDYQGDTPEQLLINQQDDYLDISLYLDQSILCSLQKENPFDCLHEGNLEHYWIAVEGVSHFLYIAWRAYFDRQVSQLELELQAEIDKYICAIYLFSQQQQKINVDALWNRLFRNYYLRDHLNVIQIKRYQQANEYAGQYCKQIHQQFKKSMNNFPCFKQLRRFYRLNQRAKIAHISSVV